MGAESSSVCIRQTRFIGMVVCALLVIPICLTLSWWVFGRPDLALREKPSAEHYAERIDLLQYMISLGLSVIGATWFLTAKTGRGRSNNDASHLTLSWAWTVLGVAILAAFVELYTSYKIYYSWYANMEDTSVSTFERVRYDWVLRASGMSYYVADICFFLGTVLLMLAVIKLVHNAAFVSEDDS